MEKSRMSVPTSKSGLWVAVVDIELHYNTHYIEDYFYKNILLRNLRD